MSDHSTRSKSRKPGFSRRSFLKGVGTAGIGSLALPNTGLFAADEDNATTATSGVKGQESPAVLSGLIPIRLNINGKIHETKVETRTTLLDALRNHLDLTGTKQVCDRGQCGACTVLMDSKPVNSCMILAVDAHGHEITTIEGISDGDNLHPVQAAFVEKDALQCGFCTPGMVMACVAVLQEKPDATIDEIREGISGNICRCGTYNRIFEAAEQARDMIKAGKITAAAAAGGVVHD